MIRKNDLALVRSNYAEGNKIMVNKPISGDRIVRVEAKIVGIYPYFALVEHKGIRWSVMWIDILLQGTSK